MILYSTAAFAANEEAQFVTFMVAGFLTANQATSNSGIDLEFNLVRVEQVRC